MCDETKDDRGGPNEVKDESLDLEFFIYGHGPVQAEGSLAGQRFYFRARYCAWSFTLCTGKPVDPAVLDGGDVPGFFTLGEYQGYAVFGDYGTDFDASYMPYDEVARLIRESAANYYAAIGLTQGRALRDDSVG